MLRELTDYYRPSQLDDALQFLSQPHTAALGGGTGLLARSDSTTHAVVDLQDLGLDYVRAEDDGLHFGAMMRLQTLVTDPTVRDIAGGLIARCAGMSAQFTERCAATIGGTLASAPSWNDLLPALLVTDAWALLRSRESQTLIPLDALLSNRRAHLTHGTLITELIVPPQPADPRFAYQRVSRTPRDRATVNVAVGRWELQVRVAVGGAGDHATRARVTEQVVDGQALTDELIAQAATQLQAEFNPPSDHIASGEYRRAMLGVLLRRALNEGGRMT